MQCCAQSPPQRGRLCRGGDGAPEAGDRVVTGSNAELAARHLPLPPLRRSSSLMPTLLGLCAGMVCGTERCGGAASGAMMLPPCHHGSIKVHSNSPPHRVQNKSSFRALWPHFPQKFVRIEGESPLLLAAPPGAANPRVESSMISPGPPPGLGLLAAIEIVMGSRASGEVADALAHGLAK